MYMVWKFHYLKQMVKLKNYKYQLKIIIHFMNDIELKIKLD